MAKFGDKGYPIPVRVTNTVTGDVVLWENMTQCERGLHIGKRAIRNSHLTKTPYRGYLFELMIDGEYRPIPKVQLAAESPKDYVGRKSGKTSTRKLAEELGITTDEVMKLFDEWLADRRERGDWEQYQHMS